MAEKGSKSAVKFQSLQNEAESWIKKNKSTTFNFLAGVEDEMKIIFNLIESGDTFYIVAPRGSNDNKWVVWSDNNSLIPKLLHIQDYLQSCTDKTTGDILDNVNQTFVQFGRGGVAARMVPPGQKEADHDSANECDFEDDDVEDDVDDDYYQDVDLDAETDSTVRMPDPQEASADQFFTGSGSSTAVHRLVRDLKSMKTSARKFGIDGSPRGNNLFIWDVKLTDMPTDTRLGKDLQGYAKKYKREPVVYLEMKFPKDYPMAPPFVRIVRPKFKFLTGHVTIGGSICMQLLTQSGWRPVNEIETILVQIRSEILSDPQTQLDPVNPDQPYDEVEAKQAFERMVQRYGWNK